MLAAWHISVMATVSWFKKGRYVFQLKIGLKYPSDIFSSLASDSPWIR